MRYLYWASAVRGCCVKQPYPLSFSFYFSSGSGVPHGIMVNPVFDPEKLKLNETGSLELCNDWEFIPGSKDKKVPAAQVEEMKSFFRRYLVLFCAVWDEQMQDAVLQDYFEGRIDFDEMLQDLDFYDQYKDGLSSIHDVQELETFCRNNDFVNMYGNQTEAVDTRKEPCAE